MSIRALSTSELLTVWEQGIVLAPAQRGVLLLSAARPEASQDELMKLSIGARDALLLDLREEIFGLRIAGLAKCPGCSEHIEVCFTTGDIRFDLHEKLSGSLYLNTDSYDIRFRLPNSLDLQSISSIRDKEAAQEHLLSRCLIEVRDRNGTKVLDQIPQEVIEAVDECMENADPQANIEIDLSCPSCGQQWQMIFDILSFFWSEIDAWAFRIFREVHALANAYGWHEAEILSMSPRRRQIYLEMIGA